jgi:hypothetical protein
MKMTPILALIVLGSALLPITVHSQDQDTAANAAILEKLTAARNAEAQQNFEAQVQRNRDLAEKQQAEATGEYKRANVFSDRLRAIVRRGPGSPGQSLVIRSSELDVKDQANLEEDLVVMSHLLEKSVGSAVGPQPKASPILGVDVAFPPGSSPARAMYLEGYGALFTLSVGFPLLPSARESNEKENASADSTWNEARQEVFGQRMDGRGYVRGEEYDERKVNTLKDTVLEALKNATHIRGLKSDDSVTVCVSGGGAALPVKLITGNNPGASKPKEMYVSERGEPRSTMLTIRVKKSDVDSFAKDKLNLDDFRKKAKIMPYAGAVDSPGTAAFGRGGVTFGGGGTGGGGGGFGANPGY